MASVVQNLDALSDDQLAELISAGQTGETNDNANRRRAVAELSRRRTFSTSPGMSWAPGLSGEAARLGAAVLFKGTTIGRVADKVGIAIDALGNSYGATAGTPGGKSKYGFLRPVPTTGLLAPVDASGATGPSVALDFAEGAAQASQFTLAAPIGVLTAGEGTETQNQEAMRQRLPALRRMQAIQYTGGDASEGEIAAMNTAIQNLSTMNDQRPAYSGRTGEPLFQSLDEASQSEILRYLSLARADLNSGDEKKIAAASELIRGAAGSLDRHYANMEAVTDSTQEWTWPWQRAGEVLKDEIAPYFSGDRMFDTITGKIPYHGFGDWLNPVGKNITQYKAWQSKEVNPQKRNQGDDLLDEFDARARTSVNGADPVQVRDNKIMAEQETAARRAPQPLGGRRKKKLLSQDAKQINE